VNLCRSCPQAPADRGGGRPRLRVGRDRRPLPARDRRALGGRRTRFYFLHDASEVDAAVTQLRIALLGGGLVAILLALAAARSRARHPAPPSTRPGAPRRESPPAISRPASRSSRTDELGLLAADLNRMAAAQEEIIERLRATEAGKPALRR